MAEEHAERLRALAAEVVKDPRRLEVFLRVMNNPRGALESLDLLIRNPATSEESRRRYQGVRNALEDFMLETENTK